jgi:hypothetical protein
MERLDAVEIQSRARQPVRILDRSVDCVYIAASALDARFTRICVASVRHFYPDVPIRLLAGGRLSSRFADELRRYWSVGLAEIPAGEYGWGFVKLEPLFGATGERFLVLDSDTVLTGPILRLWNDSDALFLVDEESQTEADTRRLYYDWQRVREIDPSAREPQFVFNSGQWFGTSGVLTRNDFTPWVEWTMPRKLRYPRSFMPGDQGILNYVFNQKAMLDGMRIDRRRIMRWPGHGMDGFNVESVANQLQAALVVHWAGIKTLRQRDMPGVDLLAFFERAYYRRIPAGVPRRIIAGSHDTLVQSIRHLKTKLKLASRKLTRRAVTGDDPCRG